MKVHLRLAGRHASELYSHLFPGDGLEGVALLLCGVHHSRDLVALCSRAIFPIPHDKCTIRRPDLLSWPTILGLPAFERAQREELAIVKVHSHPGGLPEFSPQDGRSDRELLGSLSGWCDQTTPHGSAVMLPDGAMFGRILSSGDRFEPFARISIAGSDIRFFQADRLVVATDEADLRNVQTFGPGTTRLLKGLSVGVAGCSGTGSWVVEMFGRLGVGRLVLVDPDRLELKNLNRIVGSRRADAEQQRFKVEVMRRSIHEMRLGTVIETYPHELANKDVIRALATCDTIFGCLDSADGRDILNRLSSAYCIPYFDVGVRLNANGSGGISYVGGAVHYVQPGGSSLMNRGVISPASIAASELRRHDPDEFKKRLGEGYIHGVPVESPAVSSINGFHASLAVNDFLARLHPFRLTPNSETDAIFSNVTDSYIQPTAHPESCSVYAPFVGMGDQSPLLGLIGL